MIQMYAEPVLTRFRKLHDIRFMTQLQSVNWHQGNTYEKMSKELD